MANSNLTSAKKAKNDEFYTQYHDIEKEVAAYLEFNPDVFRDKTILLPCDDPEWSNFTKFFAQNFEKFGLKKLISTSYAVESKKYKTAYQPTLFETESPEFDAEKTRVNGKIFELTRDKTGDKKIDIEDLEWRYLEGDGDFRSAEIKKLRDEADIIVTNPPFSLFREFLAWILKADKQFLIIGNMGAVIYKEIFPLIKDNRLWLGVTRNGTGSMWFRIGDGMPIKTGQKTDTSGVRYQTVGNTAWFTNIDHGRRHQSIPLMTQADVIKFGTKKPFDKYENYNAIDVPLVKYIPSDYDGVMGVPISFLGKYNPEQFEIIWQASGNSYANMPKELLKIVNFIPNVPGAEGAGQGVGVVGGKKVYSRILIKRKDKKGDRK